MGFLTDFEVLMPDKAFSESHDVEKAIELGLIYLNTLLPDLETGLVPYMGKPANLSPDLISFIDANKEKRVSGKIYNLDKELNRAYKLQKVANDYLLNKNTWEGRRARLLEKNGDKLSIRIPKTPYQEEGGNETRKAISKKLGPFEEIRVLAMLEELREKDLTKTVNGIKLVVSNSVDEFDLNPLPLQFFCYTNDPIKITINLCKIYFGRKGISVEFENEFRMNLFHSILNIPPDPHIIAKLLVPVFSATESTQIKSASKSMKRNEKHTLNVLQLRVSIKGISPQIWRKLLVTSDTTLHDLHLMIQAAFGWYNYHLYKFSDGNESYSRPDDWDEFEPKDMDSTKVTLGDLNLSVGGKLTYVYDFGDYWEHIVSVQKILAMGTSISFPALIGGKRNGPPEDCGGSYGYYDVLKKATDPQDPEHKEIVEWLGEYDPEEFDLGFADAQVKNYKNMEVSF